MFTQPRSLDFGPSQGWPRINGFCLESGAAGLELRSNMCGSSAALPLGRAFNIRGIA
jgi:hypothetical protein